jgi:hypothetical protein
MNTQEQLAWAKKELKDIMDVSSKTRYKELASTPNGLQDLESAFLFVADAKAKNYKTAMSGFYLTSFNWVNENPDMTKNILLLQQNMVAISDIAMLPE